MKNDVRHPGRRGGDAIFGAVFSGKSDPAAADGFLFQGLPVKAEALVGLGPLVQGHSPEAHAGPGGELEIAVLPQHIAGDGFVINARLAGQSAEETGCVQPGARAEDPAPGEADLLSQLPCDDVAGVCNVDENAVKAAFLDFSSIAADGGNGKVHLGQTVVGAPEQLDLAHAVDDDVAVFQIGEIPGPDGDPMGHIGHGIPEILDLAGHLLLVLIHQDQLVHDALDGQGIGHMGPHMSDADDAGDSFLCHNEPSFLFSLGFSLRFVSFSVILI